MEKNELLNFFHTKKIMVFVEVDEKELQLQTKIFKTAVKTYKEKGGKDTPAITYDPVESKVLITFNDHNFIWVHGVITGMNKDKFDEL